MKRLVVGVSGASGAPLALHLLEELNKVPGWESHLVVSRGARVTMETETGLTLLQAAALAHHSYDNDDIGAAIASGTFATAGMVVIPCSMKTVAGICSGYADTLLLRAADVTIKEQRPLVLVARESPLSPIHLRNLTDLAKLGVTIMPPMMEFYTKPGRITDMTHHIVCKILARWGIEVPGYQRWSGVDAI